MHRVFQSFIDGLEASGDVEHLRTVLADAAAALNLSCFAYLSMPSRRGDAAVLISNYPVTWTDHYLRQHYERVDPVIVQALTSTEPFEWGQVFTAKRLSKPQYALLDEAARLGSAVASLCPSTARVVRSRRSRSPRTKAARRSGDASSKIGLCCSLWRCIFMLTHAEGCRSIASSMVSRCRRGSSNASNGLHRASLHGRSDVC